MALSSESPLADRLGSSLETKDSFGLSTCSLPVSILPKFARLILDLLQSLGWLLSCYNLARDDVLPSFACSVQGFFINSGDVGSSIWSLVIAIHTVLLLAGGQRARVWAAEKSTGGKERWILAVCIWLSIVFLGLIGPLAIEGLHPEDGPFCKVLT